jgi:predicted DNA-binding transcriptional regulator AlpA
MTTQQPTAHSDKIQKARDRVAKQRQQEQAARNGVNNKRKRLTTPAVPPARPVEQRPQNLATAPPAQYRPPERFLSWADLFARGLINSKTQARRLWMRGDFPKPVHLSQRVIAFRESEIEAWAATRTAEWHAAEQVA